MFQIAKEKEIIVELKKSTILRHLTNKNIFITLNNMCMYLK